jgi:hypothetical protein
MKTFIILFLLVLTFVYTTANKKIKDNQVVELTEAIKIIQATTKKLALKENVSSADKLDESWSDASNHSFDLFEETAKTFIIKGYNAKNRQTLYFIIDKHGHVREVMGAEYFSAYSKSLKST